MRDLDSLFHENFQLNRRSFIRISGMLGLGLVTSGILPEKTWAERFDKKTYRVARTRSVMGTSVSMTILDQSKDKAEEAIDLAFEEIDRLSGLMNRFDRLTAVGQLNSEGFLKDVHPDIMEVISGSLEYYRLSQGAFDISVKPIVDLFKDKFQSAKGEYPSKNEIEDCLTLIGSDKIELSNRSIRFRDPGMGITLDGIAKGYIVDKASGILANNNVENHLINAGGDIRAIGHKEDGRQWTVAIQDPLKRTEQRDVIKLTDASIATSGNYEVYFDNEKMFHHIVDPETGLSPVLSNSVSVVAPTTMQADALSTSVFVMNANHGIKFVDSLADCSALIITRTNRLIRSANWRSALS